MARSKYTKDDLYKNTGNVKRSIINDFRKGKRTKITKTEVLDMIYPRLGLGGRKALYKSPNMDYINEWYAKLQNEIEVLIIQSVSFEEVSLKEDSIEDISKTLAQKEKYIFLLEKRIEELSKENEELREAYNGKYNKIDLEEEAKFPF